MSEYDDKLNQGAAPQPQDPPAPDPVPRPRKVRRVGTFTFGLVLVAAGVLLILRSVMPQLDLSFVASLAPVVLIALGIEVLIYAARPDVTLT